MRIISGLFKGKKILEPKDFKTRPLKDLTKESIFNIINHSKKFTVDLKNIMLDNNDYIFHAGTLRKEKKIYAIGGRVLNFVTLAEDFNLAKKNIIRNLNELNWLGGFYRKDIGYKVTK